MFFLTNIGFPNLREGVPDLGKTPTFSRFFGGGASLITITKLIFIAIGAKNSKGFDFGVFIQNSWNPANQYDLCHSVRSFRVHLSTAKLAGLHKLWDFLQAWADPGPFSCMLRFSRQKCRILTFWDILTFCDKNYIFKCLSLSPKFFTFSNPGLQDIIWIQCSNVLSTLVRQRKVRQFWLDEEEPLNRRWRRGTILVSFSSSKSKFEWKE